MSAWAGIALALRGPDEDGMRSRLPTYVHPLAGRSLVWHTLRTMVEVPGPARQLYLVGKAPFAPAIIGELPVEIVTTGPGTAWADLIDGLDPEVEHVLITDAAAATVGTSLVDLCAGPTGTALVGIDEEVLALWLPREIAAVRASCGATLEDMARGLEIVRAHSDTEAFLVRDRATFAHAVRIIRDRIVQRILDGGATVLLPETVLIDVDVQIGQDTIIYPGAVLEGQTTVGAETVIGPGCHVIDSRIGSGVELKGWNYIVGANIRNRAVLEPYVRRGFD